LSKVLLFSDIHIHKHKKSESRLADCLKCLQWVFDVARKNNIKFDWHIRYHDHIIRNEEEFLRISNYIKNNPSKWLDDKFNKSK
jgi:hypothetical protein